MPSAYGLTPTSFTCTSTSETAERPVHSGIADERTVRPAVRSFIKTSLMHGLRFWADA